MKSGKKSTPGAEKKKQEANKAKHKSHVDLNDTAAKKANSAAPKPLRKPPKDASKLASKPASKTKSKSELKSESKSETKPKLKTEAPARKRKTGAAETPPAAEIKKRGRTARPKSFEQLPAAKDFGFASETPELPENYGQDRLVLMTQEPDILFSYWEITPPQLQIKEAEKRRGEQYREALKLNWPAQSLFDQDFAMVPISFAARRWYLKVPFPGLLYQVEIGWLGSRGDFISILNSNPSESPERWEMSVKRLRAAGEVLSYSSSRVSQPLGSSGSLQVQKIFFTSLDWVPGSISSSTAGRAGRKKTTPASG